MLSIDLLSQHAADFPAKPPAHSAVRAAKPVGLEWPGSAVMVGHTLEFSLWSPCAKGMTDSGNLGEERFMASARAPMRVSAAVERHKMHPCGGTEPCSCNGARQ